MRKVNTLDLSLSLSLSSHIKDHSKQPVQLHLEFSLNLHAYHELPQSSVAETGNST